MADILLPDMYYKMFIRKNKGQLNQMARMPMVAPGPMELEMRFVGGLTNDENAHISRHGIDLKLYLKERKEKYGY